MRSISGARSYSTRCQVGCQPPVDGVEQHVAGPPVAVERNAERAGVEDPPAADRPVGGQVGVAADHDRLLDAGQPLDHALLGRDRGHALPVAARRAVDDPDRRPVREAQAELVRPGRPGAGASRPARRSAGAGSRTRPGRARSGRRAASPSRPGRARSCRGWPPSRARARSRASRAGRGPRSGSRPRRRPRQATPRRARPRPPRARAGSRARRSGRPGGSIGHVGDRVEGDRPARAREQHQRAGRARLVAK